MAGLEDCLNAAAADGRLSGEAAKEYIERLAELIADGVQTGRLSVHGSQVRAASRLQREIERKINRKKRMRIKQAAKLDIITARLRAAPLGTRHKAALSVLDFDPSLRHVGENVSMRHQTTRGAAFAAMVDFVDKFRSKHGGLTRNTAGMGDVVKGLFGEKTTVEAKALAQGIMRAREVLVGRHNLAGGDIEKRTAWGWVQKHDLRRVARVSEDEWSEFVLQRLDPARMLDASGQPMSARQLVRTVRGSYQSIKSGGLEEMAGSFNPDFTSPVNARIAHRELAFRDSRAWLEYQTKFGDPDIFGAIVGEIDRLARDVAIMEVMGPYPRGTLAAIKLLVDEDRSAAALAATGRKSARLAERIGKHKMLEAVFDQASGQANIPSNNGWARASQSNRNLLVAARLGSALFVSLSDFATNTLTARMNGVPITRLLAELFQQLNPANGAHRRMAARAGYVSETWVGHAIAAQRLMGEVTGAPSTARIADSVLRLSGLSWWTDAGRSAFKLEFIGHMTDNAGKAFAQVEPALRRSLQRHGITPQQWDLYRSTAIWRDEETGAEFIRPEDLWLEIENMVGLPIGEKTARFEAAQRFGEMVAAEAHFAVVVPTARARAFTTGGTTPGTFWGELVRNLTLFRSFTVSFTHLHMSRMMAERGLRSKAAYGAWIAIGMTVGGAIAEQASAIFRGKDPRDMSEPKFWASAVIRGGSLGPLGDFLYSSTSRHGANLAEGLLGPVLGSEVSQGVRLTIGNIQDLIKDGELRNAGSDLTRFADGLLPGRSLWYTRLAWERFLSDEIQAWIDGGDAAARFRRTERAARRDFDQRFWWRPGTLAPQRAPDPAAAVGR